MDKFRFKQFEVSHQQSSMRLGVDAVTLGAWACVSDAETILDVGTGCGIIALMCAQRNPDARILAVDIHKPSTDEAAMNFASSPWGDRLRAEECSYRDINKERKFDLIISNPPYFDSGVTAAVTARERARHQAELSPQSLLEWGAGHLSSKGHISLIAPYEQKETIIAAARHNNLYPHRTAAMKGRPDLEPKRILLEFYLNEKPIEEEEISLEEAPGVPTERNRELCRDFYLKY